MEFIILQRLIKQSLVIENSCINLQGLQISWREVENMYKDQNNNPYPLKK